MAEGTRDTSLKDFLRCRSEDANNGENFKNSVFVVFSGPGQLPRGEERRLGTVMPVSVRDFVVKFGDWGSITNRREIGGPVLLLYSGVNVQELRTMSHKYITTREIA